MIGTEKRENLAADAPAKTVVKREVARAGLLVVSSVKSSMLSDRLGPLINNSNEVSRLTNAPCIGSVKGKI